MVRVFVDPTVWCKLSFTERMTAIEANGPSDAPGVANARPAPHPVFWVIAGALLVIATAEVVRLDDTPGGIALAQPVMSGGARGVFAFSGQLSKGTHGVYMVDLDKSTIWVYEYLAQKGCLRLAAARTWKYDRFLEDFNGCDLPPDAVELMVEQERKTRLQQSEMDMP